MSRDCGLRDYCRLEIDDVAMLEKASAETLQMSISNVYLVSSQANIVIEMLKMVRYR